MSEIKTIQCENWDIDSVVLENYRSVRLSTYPNNCSIVIISNLYYILNDTDKFEKLLEEITNSDIIDVSEKEDFILASGEPPSLIQLTVNLVTQKDYLVTLGFQVTNKYVSRGSNSTIYVMSYDNS